MSMSKKHFEALAAAILNTKQAIEDGVVGSGSGVCLYATQEIADVCARFNPNFDRARFLKACGVEEAK